MTQDDGKLRQAGDDALVAWARGGCRAAFDELARRYRPGVRLLARQIVGDAARADDVAQDVLLTAFRALPTLTDPTRFGAWLAAIARHRSRRVAARESRFVPLEASHLDARSAPPAPAVSDDLSDAFSALADDYQTVLRLRYWDEWSVGQIAAFLALPVTTVKWRLHHARELLRRRLSPQWKEKENGNL